MAPQYFCPFQQTAPYFRSTTPRSPSEHLLPNESFASDPGRKQRPLLVVFVGGVTYGEVACVRILERVYNTQITILTTQMLNLKRFLENVQFHPIEYYVRQ